MKQLKFDHSIASQVYKGKKTVTFRVADDKDISKGDKLQIVDKVDSDRPSTWQIIGEAGVTAVDVTEMDKINSAKYPGHENQENPQDMLMALRRYYGDHVSAQTPIKVIEFKFEPYAEPKPFFEAGFGVIPSAGEKLPAIVKLYADGGSRGNPGPSALGYVVCASEGAVLREGSKYLGVTTNNQAEYHALKSGLETCLAEGASEVDVFMDSLLVVNQMKGIFKVKNRDLWPIYDSIKKISQQFKRITFSHVPRELNKLADAEVNKALDAVKS